MVSEKYADFYMTNQAAGYSNVHERWAVRISNNGDSSTPTRRRPGRRATPTSPTAASTCPPRTPSQYFNTAIYGDPVEVTGTSIQLSYADGDIWDWAVDWDEWKSMSALSDTNPVSSMPSTAPATPTDAPTLSGTPTTTTPSPTTTSSSSSPTSSSVTPGG